MPVVSQSRRRRIFLAGLIGSLILFTTFWALGMSSVASTRDGRIVGRALYDLFLWTNPLLTLFGWWSMKAWGPAPPHGLSRVILPVISVTLFVVWWWAVALVVDRVAPGRKRLANDA